GRDRAVFRVLVVIEEDAVSLFLPPLARGEIGRALLNFPGDREGGAADLLKVPKALDPHVHVYPSRARSLRPANETVIGEYVACDEGALANGFPGYAGHGVEVDAKLVGMLEVVGADRVGVQVDAA